jgi:hypothetical protein
MAFLITPDRSDGLADCPPECGTAEYVQRKVCAHLHPGDPDRRGEEQGVEEPVPMAPPALDR